MSQVKITQNPLSSTVFILAASATVGAIGAIVIGLPAAMTVVTVMGPFAWLTLGPLLLAVAALSMTWIIIGVPIFTIVGGFIAGKSASGNLGSVAKRHQVTFFTDSHPIMLRVQELAAELELPVISWVGWFPEEQINAFAMGTMQENALIAVSQGAIEKLSKDELDAVLAHELAHVANNDMARMTFARGAQEALTFFLLFRGLKKLARWLFTPLSELEILRFSRKREFAADKIAAELISPAAMIGALECINSEQDGTYTATVDDTIKLSGFWNTGSLMSTHPPLEKRITALGQIAVPVARPEPEEEQVKSPFSSQIQPVAQPHGCLSGVLGFGG